MCLKTTGDMRERSWQLARRLAPVTGAFVIGFIIWTHVTAGRAFWLNVIELLAILAVLAAVWLVWDHHEGFAFAATAVTIASCIISIFADLYPNVMVSSTNPAYNLTVHNTASGGVLAQGDDRRRDHLPARWYWRYQAWTYYVFRRRVSREEFAAPESARQEPGTDAAVRLPVSEAEGKGP